MDEPGGKWQDSEAINRSDASPGGFEERTLSR